jgi:phosphoglycolate phosphatase
MFNTIIFDLDMTLLDSLEGTYIGANLFADHFGLPRVTKARILSDVSLPTKEFWTHLWGEFHDEWEDYLHQAVIPEIQKHTKLFPDGEDILNSAINKGYHLAVASNRVNPWHDLATLNLGKYFDTVVGSSDVPRPKPYPDMLLTILQQLEIEAQTAIYVGDTTVDMNCARSADIKALGLTQSGADPNDLFAAGASFVRPSLAQSRDILGC